MSLETWLLRQKWIGTAGDWFLGFNQKTTSPAAYTFGCNTSNVGASTSVDAEPPLPPLPCPDFHCRLTPDKSSFLQGAFGSAYLTLFYIWNFDIKKAKFELWNHAAKQNLAALEGMLRANCGDDKEAGAKAIANGMKTFLEDHYKDAPADKNEKTLVLIASVGNIKDLDHAKHKEAVAAALKKAEGTISSPVGMQSLLEGCDLFARILMNEDWIDNDSSNKKVPTRFSAPKVKGGAANKDKAKIEEALKEVEKAIKDLQPGNKAYDEMDPLAQNWVRVLWYGIANIERSMNGGVSGGSGGKGIEDECWCTTGPIGDDPPLPGAIWSVDCNDVPENLIGNTSNVRGPRCGRNRKQ